MVPVAAPAARRVELILADLVGGQRGGPRVAAEERGEMGDPATSGALGPELPDLVVLEVGVAEISQGRPLGAERARERRRCACVTGGGGRDGLGRGHGLGSSCVVAAGRRRPSTFALVGATGKGNVRRRRDGESTCSAYAALDDLDHLQMARVVAIRHVEPRDVHTGGGELFDLCWR